MDYSQAEFRRDEKAFMTDGPEPATAMERDFSSSSAEHDLEMADAELDNERVRNELGEAENRIRQLRRQVISTTLQGRWATRT